MYGKLDRRGFLKALGLGASSLAAGQIPAVEVQSRTYINRRLGVRLERPKGWYFASILEIQAELASQQLAHPDPAACEELKETEGPPLLSIERTHKASHEDPHFYLCFEDVAGVALTPLQAQRASYGLWYQDYLRDHRMIEKPTATEFRGFEASRCLLGFTFESKGKAPQPVVLESLLVRRDDQAFTANSVDRADTGWSPETRAAFKSILDSIQLLEPNPDLDAPR